MELHPYIPLHPLAAHFGPIHPQLQLQPFSAYISSETASPILTTQNLNHYSSLHPPAPAPVISAAPYSSLQLP